MSIAMGNQTRVEPEYQPAVPALLAFVAGYVDVTTFLAFSGLFVAQATGSLVVAGAALETGGAAFVKVAAIPVFLIAGVGTTALVRGFGAARARAFAVTLFAEAGIIGGMALSALLVPHDALLGPLLGLAAMGVQSALARLLLASYGSTNVMTSNLTQFSIDIETAVAGYLRGQPDRAALRGVERLGLTLMSFALGVVLGGAGYRVAGMSGLVLMVATLAAMARWVLADAQRLNRAWKAGHNA